MSTEPIVPPVPPKAPEVPPVVPPVVPPPAEPTVYESAATAVEAWQKNQTPELKTAMDEAIKKAKEFQPTPPKVAPDKYDLKLPEGSKLDAKHLENVTAFAKANKLSQEEAKALLERDHDVSKAQLARLDADAKAYVEGLIPLAKADKDIGGENFDKNVQLAQRVVKKFDTNGVFEKMLDETGYGNHPEVIRIFRNIGKAMKEDELVIAPPPPPERKPTAEVLYGPK